MAADRKRKKELKIFLSDEEESLLEEKLKKSGMTNKSAYVRKMILDGYIINTDLSIIKNMNFEINKIGTNINQIAKKVNEMININESEIDEIKDYMKSITKIQNEILSKLSESLGSR